MLPSTGEYIHVTTDKGGRVEGVTLTPEQDNKMLNHFICLVIGKPGSGKSHVVKTLVNDPYFYKGKFDNIMVISPSVYKLGVPIKKNMGATVYNMDWIEKHIETINQEYIKRFERAIKSRTGVKNVIPYITYAPPRDSLTADIQKNKMYGYAYVPSDLMVMTKNERFFTAETISIMNSGINSIGGRIQDPIAKGGGGVKRKSKEISKASVGGGGAIKLGSPYGRYVDVDDIEKYLVRQLTPEEYETTRYNLLIILDDMVAAIKAHEHDPRQTQLFFNRRHVIANGTISLIVVSQKFTMIPSRLRSSASWVILFRVGKQDLETVYKDVVLVSPQKWQAMVDYVFEVDDNEGINKDKTSKTYNHLDIFVEYDMFFKNFKPLMFL